MIDLECLETSRARIYDIGDNTGWWHALLLTETILDYKLLEIYPKINHLFVMHYDTMDIFG